MREYIIRDSSSSKSNASLMSKDYSIRVGMVREHVFLASTKQTRYIVEVWKSGRMYPLTCTRVTRFGGLYNYEEYNHRGYNVGDLNTQGNFKIAPGDMVIVAAIDGSSREGIILGAINHFGRSEYLPSTGDVAFINEFNGIQQIINSAGEYRRTFKGVPTNISKLNEAPSGNKYPLPEYNLEVGFSYYEFDKTGSYTVSDNAVKLPQSIKIDKPNGKIQILSGDTSLVIDKNAQSYTIANKTTSFSSTDSWSLKTKVTTIESTDSISAKAKDIKTEGKWDQKGDMKIKGNIEQTGDIKISGKISNEGEVSLAGGQYPLIYDIILTMGIGNLGAPVISSNIYLKTVKTKAS